MEELLVIKIGGETLDNLDSLEKNLNAVTNSGKKIILVHGGGRKVTELASRLGVKQQMVEGRRITSSETLDLCTMVYGGLISKNIVAALSRRGKKAIGLSGADLGCIISRKRENANVDFGYVGDVQKVDGDVFSAFVDQETIPVVCSITLGENFELLNTNADTMAAEIAIAMAAKYQVKLIYCFEKNGVLENVENNDLVIHELTAQQFELMKSAGKVADGMIPKLQTGFRALFKGVKKVKIINSNFLGDLMAGEQTGTEIKLY